VTASTRGTAPAATNAKGVRPAGRRHVLVVGGPEDLPRALNHPGIANGRFDVVATIAIDPEGEGFPVRDAINDALKNVDAILVAGPLGESTMRRVTDLAILHHCELLAVMPTDVLYGHEPVIVWHHEAPLVRLSSVGGRRFQLSLKRAMDIAGSAVMLAVTSPLLAVLALAIRLESPGAAIFRHERIGFRGRRFQCLKLRTMRTDAEELLRTDAELYEEYRRNHFKIPDDRDPRVTRLGRILRRTSLDELPQFWNVLVGDMSLVGPRPVVEDELELYEDSRDVVLSVRPGITGAWAVNGRQNIGYPDRCTIELRYVREWTLAKDIPILMKTLLVVGAPFRSGKG
jgi:lipopolysaccharide/colanic/teichoic acid biosynthesis glycosyltransferase